MGTSKMELYAILTCGGSVTVWGFITISVVFVLCLIYVDDDGKTALYGTASVTYSIRIGFFKKSFSLTFSKKLAGTQQESKADTYVPIKNNGASYAVLHEDGKERKSYRYTGYEEAELIYEDFGEGNDTPPTKTDLKSRYTAMEWERFCKAYRL